MCLPAEPSSRPPFGHGFNCDARDSYHAESAKLALQRTLDLFAKHIGG